MSGAYSEPGTHYGRWLLFAPFLSLNHILSGFITSFKNCYLINSTDPKTFLNLETKALSTPHGYKCQCACKSCCFLYISLSTPTLKTQGRHTNSRRFRRPDAVEPATLYGWLRDSFLTTVPRQSTYSQSTHSKQLLPHSASVLIPCRFACSQHCAHTSMDTHQGLPSVIPVTLSASSAFTNTA